MKTLVAMIVLMFSSLSVRTNEYTVRSLNAENKIFIITLDGFRWQEIFGGADSALLNNSAYTSNAAVLNELYGGQTTEERRKKLMPFLWNIVAQQGEIYGNRKKGSFMNVANPFALSYPGYNELLTGSVDISIFNNGKTPNHNSTLLDALNATATYRGKVAAFASWDAFPFILNKEKSSVFINSGFDELTKSNLSATEALINSMQNEADDQKTTRYDELTYLACREYIQKKRPAVVFLSFGGTDEAAHQKKYDQYLQQAANADRMIGELWQYLQTLPEYKDKTTFLITTDHGRGASTGNWYTHGILVDGSSQTWMALLGPAIPQLGERRASRQLYLKNVKELAMKILAQP
ncbi:alkaline phosphatase family protein [Flavisolibacter ginsenosidimutans]|uniref:LTA synthase family protein n=1 Tax=Flavisolibacter ginsenosidimutans TaxID=661481 RepID=A0A5B8UNS4_9BACT|nr:alkaline phosphatase family protein [Flavisolibacter ginsenosidimutans]QEC57595.1 LTA synthase family protein [Flavisolibacter ginsenosidimutans]